MNREEYRTVYLQSEHWRETRARALIRAGNRCQVCNGANQLDVHHRTYERIGHEEDGDLTVLCRRCHDLFHRSAGVKAPKKQHVNTKLTREQRAAKRATKAGTLAGIAKQARRDATRAAGKKPRGPKTDAEKAMEARNVGERRRRKAEREARARKDFEQGRTAKPWDTTEARISGAERPRHPIELTDAEKQIQANRAAFKRNRSRRAA